MLYNQQGKSLVRKKLDLLSHNAIIDPHNDYTWYFNLDQIYSAVTDSTFVGASVPCTFHQIDDHSDRITIEYPATSTTYYVATLTHGTYDVDDLCTEIVRALEAVVGWPFAGGTFTVVYEPAPATNQRIVMTDTTPLLNQFALICNPAITPLCTMRGLCDIIGTNYGTDYTSALVGLVHELTLPNAYQGMGGCTHIYPMCLQLFNHDYYGSNNQYLNNGCIGEIPVVWTEEGQIHYTVPEEEQNTHYFNPPRTIDTIKLQFYAILDETQEIRYVTFGGGFFKIKIVIHYYK